LSCNLGFLERSGTPRTRQRAASAAGTAAFNLVEQLVVGFGQASVAVLVGLLGCPEQNSRNRGGALLSLGGGKGGTERGWLVSVPNLVADDLFVRSDVVMEPGLGAKWVSVVVS
jgi:hypothetical protein